MQPTPEVEDERINLDGDDAPATIADCSCDIVSRPCPENQNRRGLGVKAVWDVVRIRFRGNSSKQLRMSRDETGREIDHLLVPRAVRLQLVGNRAVVRRFRLLAVIF